MQLISGNFPDFIKRFQTAILPNGEQLHILAGSGGQVGFIRTCKGDKIPLHQHQDSWTILISGEMSMTVGDKVFTASNGDNWLVSEGIMHGGEALQDSLIVEVFSEQRYSVD